MGLFHGPIENSRQPERGEKTRRDFPLEFRLRSDPEVRGRFRSLRLAGTEKIEIPQHRTACARDNCKRLKAGVLRLDPNAILAVLHNGIVQLQLLFGRHDIIRAVTFEIEFAKHPELPVVIRLVNQRRFREHAFKTQLVAEKPDDTAARSNYRILVNATAKADDAED